MPEPWTVLESRTATVTDLGRSAVGRGLCAFGALDQHAARTANALVGSPLGAAVIEVSLLDLALRVSGPAVLAVTGADADLVVDGTPVSQRAAVAVAAGSHIAIRRIRQGLRCYLAVHGSFDVPRLLGSCAPDRLLGFGRPLQTGDALLPIVEPAPLRHPHFDIPLFRLRAEASPRPRVVEITEGPDAAEFDDPRRLSRGTFSVDDRSNDVGIRLTGDAPARTVTTEIRSAGVPIGAIEVTGHRQVIALHRGRGVTAGYAIPAVATRQGLDVLAQVRPGDAVSFRYCDAADAVLRHRQDIVRLEEIRSRALIVLGHHGVGTTTRIWRDAASQPRAEH